MIDYYILRIKKPHKKFNIGDIVIGEIVDGMAERMVCSGWSNKLNCPILNYSIRYQQALEIKENWRDRRKNQFLVYYPSGHANIIGKFQFKELEIENNLEKLLNCKTKKEFFQAIFGGKLLGLVEATATHQQMLNNLKNGLETATETRNSSSE